MLCFVAWISLFCATNNVLPFTSLSECQNIQSWPPLIILSSSTSDPTSQQHATPMLVKSVWSSLLADLINRMKQDASLIWSAQIICHVGSRAGVSKTQETADDMGQTKTRKTWSPTVFLDRWSIDGTPTKPIYLHGQRSRQIPMTDNVVIHGWFSSDP